MSWQSSPITDVAADVHRRLQAARVRRCAPPPRSRTAGRSRRVAATRAPGATTAEGCTPGAAAAADACSIRAHSRARATDGWSTTRKSWSGRGFADVIRRHQHHRRLRCRATSALYFGLPRKDRSPGRAVPSAEMPRIVAVVAPRAARGCTMAAISSGVNESCMADESGGGAGRENPVVGAAPGTVTPALKQISGRPKEKTPPGSGGVWQGKSGPAAGRRRPIISSGRDRAR